MLTKLSLRNAKRSIKDYLIYLLTMSGVAALMFAFDSMIFSKDIAKMCEFAGIMGAMIGLATVVIIAIVAWLINYMVKFMFGKRSKEFGTYLILGMNQKEIANLYLRENLFMGAVSFLAGSVAGFFLEQGLLTIFYQLFSKEYQIHIDFSWLGLLMAFVCYSLCFGRTMLRCKKMFQKMTISDFMRLDKENERVKEGRDGLLQVLFPVGIVLLGGVYYALFHFPATQLGIACCIACFIAGIYALYIGLASMLLRYLRKNGGATYKKQNLFLLRQLASKLRTMRVTMGTLTMLLCVALLGGTVAMMFAKHQKRVVENVFPFDIIMYHQDSNYLFEEQRKLIEQDTPIEEQLCYQIYHTEDSTMNYYLGEHNPSIRKEYRDENGNFDVERFKEKNWAYCKYDTYMLESDYNTLRTMLGLQPVSLGEQGYVIQCKQRIDACMNEEIRQRRIVLNGQELSYIQSYTDDFSQNGHNGADYVIVVPDTVKEALTPYYSVCAVKLAGEPSNQLQEQLNKQAREINHLMSEDEYYAELEHMALRGASQEEIDEFESREQLMVFNGITMEAMGSDQILSVAGDVMVKKSMRQDTLFAVASIIFPTVYIGLVFLCVALTILAVQQLSDSGKFKFRYDVLRKLGLSEHEIEGVVLKQLLIYYMVPALAAVVLSAVISVYVGNQFVVYSGASGNGWYYYSLSLLIFFGVYFLYFIATYVGFIRNVRKNEK